MNRHAPSPPDCPEERQQNRSNLICYMALPSTLSSPVFIEERL
jgi:hypothetical protein